MERFLEHEKKKKFYELIKKNPGMSKDQLHDELKAGKSTITIWTKELKALAEEDEEIKRVVEKHVACRGLKRFYKHIKENPGMSMQKSATELKVTRDTIFNWTKRIEKLADEYDDLKEVFEKHVKSRSHKPKTDKTYMDLLKHIQENSGNTNVDIAKDLDTNCTTLARWMGKLNEMAEKDKEIRMILKKHRELWRLRGVFLHIKDHPGAKRKDIANKLGIDRGTVTNRLKKLKKVSEKYEDVRKVVEKYLGIKIEKKPALEIFLEDEMNRKFFGVIKEKPGLKGLRIMKRELDMEEIGEMLKELRKLAEKDENAKKVMDRHWEEIRKVD